MFSFRLKSAMIPCSMLQSSSSSGTKTIPVVGNRGGNIYVLNPTENYDECDKWCIGNSACGGYTTSTDPLATQKRCNFKNRSCKNHLIHSSVIDTSIPQGKTANYIAAAFSV